MKAISIQQPWASLIITGAKRVETRSWATRYRGPILIHSSAGMPKLNRELCATEPFLSYGKHIGIFHHGSILGRAVLKDVVPVEKLVQEFDQYPGMYGTHELKFGDYTPGRFGWVLGDVEEFAAPIPAKGQLGIWNYRGGIPSRQWASLSDRELDAEICEKLLGWVEWQTPADGSGDPDTRSMILIESKESLERLFKSGFTLPPKGKIARSFLCPQHSRDLESALWFARKVGLQLCTPLPRPRQIVELAFAYGLKHKSNTI
ncbi:ASCH domain-containing protein [Chitinophaga lutea]|nr:ASCH domain-containing protein [Chitinophaga lutea]